MNLPPLIRGSLIKRYKRFLADIQLADGSVITAHCPNSGSMLGCQASGSPVMVSDHPEGKRKYRYTWEMVQVGEVWVGINTMIPNRLAGEAIAAGVIPELGGYSVMRNEVSYGVNSRIDWLLTQDAQNCYVEVKNVTLVEGNIALFPDSVTERGRKHLTELSAMVQSGHRAVMLFLVQRMDADSFQPAAKIDPKYASALADAFSNGVEILVYQADVTPNSIHLVRSLPWKLGPS